MLDVVTLEGDHVRLEPPSPSHVPLLCEAARSREHGAEQLYLGVMEANAPARSVYEQLGFATLYAYHYRVQR